MLGEETGDMRRRGCILISRFWGIRGQGTYHISWNLQGTSCMIATHQRSVYGVDRALYIEVKGVRLYKKRQRWWGEHALPGIIWGDMDKFMVAAIVHSTVKWKGIGCIGQGWAEHGRKSEIMSTHIGPTVFTCQVSRRKYEWLITF